MPQLTTSLRQSLRQKRKKILLSDRAQFNHSINQSLLKAGFHLRSSIIASYLANDGEPALDLFIKTCSTTQCQHYLPVLDRQRLKFSPYSWGDELENNKFNIPEPSAKSYFPATLFTTIIIPLVGFDEHGHRLGMGGGYYDRTLSFMLNPLCRKKPLLIGVAYSSQMVSNIKRQAWDVPLDAIITELGLTCFTTKAKQRLFTS